jgi:hypothetical protein
VREALTRARLHAFMKALADGLVDAERFLALVNRIPDPAYARHPNLSRQMVLDAVNDFLSMR